MAVFGRPFFFARRPQDDGTISIRLSYIDAEEVEKGRKNERSQAWKMKEASDIFRIVGIVLLVIFVVIVGIPLVIKLAGITLGIIGILIWLAVHVIYLAIIIAVIYLILVGIRTVLR